MPFSVSPILGDRSPVMLNSFLVVSALKMEVFCCYERAFSAALHHEEQIEGTNFIRKVPQFNHSTAAGITNY